MANTDPIYLSMNDRPRAVLQVMDSLRTRRDGTLAVLDQRRLVPLGLFLAGLPLLALDWALGYNCLTFAPAALGLWIVAAVLGIGLRRARPAANFPPHFDTAREVIDTLRDDPDPRRPLFGHLDLSGAEQPAKQARTATNAAGRALVYYRDEWLSLKAKLYDGNMLRLSAIERVKVRQSYQKRSAVSGKLKLKPAKTASAQELKVRVSVNADAYAIVPTPAACPGARIGQYTLTEVSTSGGILELTAGSPARTIAAGDILGVLRLTYDQLQRKAGA